jgi:SMI1 / KNR4 family (SUKH-1)
MSAGGWQAVLVPDVDWTAVLRADDGCRMPEPGGASAISAAESALGVTFPGDLRALYLVSDGVFDEPGQWFVIWPLAEVVACNQAAWAGESATRRRLLAFGDDGTGAPFCLPADGEPGVLFWDPVLDEAIYLAHDLRSFWAAWTTGSLPLH